MSPVRVSCCQLTTPHHIVSIHIEGGRIILNGCVVNTNISWLYNITIHLLKQIRRLTKMGEEQSKNNPLPAFQLAASSCAHLPRACSVSSFLQITFHTACTFYNMLISPLSMYKFICFNRLSWWEPIREADVKWQQYEEGWLGQADIGNSQRGIWAIQRWIIKELNNTGLNNMEVNSSRVL